MNRLQKNIFRSAACAAVAIGATGAPIAAHADSFAQSILVINNFRLLHANGTTYSAAEFPQLAGASAAFASGQLNGVYSGATQMSDLAGGLSLDVALQNAGAGRLSARLENDVTPTAGAIPQASFGSGDQRITGGLITTPAAATPFQSSTRADASLDADGSAVGTGGVATSAAFSFSLGAGEFMTIAFDATPFTRAVAGLGADAQASLAWSVTVLDVSTGATVFTFQPEELNGRSQVGSGGGLGGGFGGGTIYDPGRLSFAATLGMLDAGDSYQVTFAQTSFASAHQAGQVAEPATLAGFGAGLLALAALGRRRRNGRLGNS